jgi:hypothetical protein
MSNWRTWNIFELGWCISHKIILFPRKLSSHKSLKRSQQGLKDYKWYSDINFFFHLLFYYNSVLFFCVWMQRDRIMLHNLSLRNYLLRKNKKMKNNNHYIWDNVYFTWFLLSLLPLLLLCLFIHILKKKAYYIYICTVFVSY